MKMRAFSTIAAALVIAGTVGAPAHAADYGDGKVACNTGEICLSLNNGSYNFQKHFWYAAEHNGYYFTDVRTGKGISTPVLNNVSAIMNRDMSCMVKIVDDRGILPDNYSTFAPGDTKWRYVGDEVNDKNDRHERC